ncbi:MAG: hypothetical protein FWH06_02930 [Oscillospiraceae bacterium]|nr:hypothetical protein [Oscillospiraceae bacterium]
MRCAAAAACAAVFLTAATVFAAAYIQNSINSFYLRHLSPEEMAVANSLAEQYGADIYFDGLKSEDLYKQYFAVNKLVEYYNNDEIREKAIRALTPLLSDEPYDKELSDIDAGAVSDAVSFALSVLTKAFDDPRIIRMADGSVVFALFNDYSDYGTYNQIWTIKDDELRVLASFNEPKRYIKQILPSPDKRLFAVELISNKSTYIEIYNENGVVSPEIIDSARIRVANELNLDYWQLPDLENYSTARAIEWAGNDVIEIHAVLWNDKTSMGAELFVDDVIVRYYYGQGRMEYKILTPE